MIRQSRQRMRHLAQHNSWPCILALCMLLIGAQGLALVPRNSHVQADARSKPLHASPYSMPTKHHFASVHKPALIDEGGTDAAISNTAMNTHYRVGDTIVYSILVSTTAASTPITSAAAINVTVLLPLGLEQITVSGSSWIVNASTMTSPALITASYTGTYPIPASTILPAITITGLLDVSAGTSYTSTASLAIPGDINSSNDTSISTFYVTTPTPIPAPTPTPTPTATPTPIGINASVSITAPNPSYTNGNTVLYSVAVGLLDPASGAISPGTPVNLTMLFPLGLTDITVNGNAAWTIHTSSQTGPSFITASYRGTYPVTPPIILPTITISGTVNSSAGTTYSATANLEISGDINTTNNTSIYTFTVEAPTPTPLASPTTIPASTPITSTPIPSPSTTSTPIPSPSTTSTPIPSPPTTSTPNLALNGQTWASSIMAGSSTAYAVDGNPNTGWSSGEDNGFQWLQVDLGGIRAINEVKLLWGVAYASAYEIQLSSDDTRWRTIAHTTNGVGGAEDLTGLSGSGHYLRVYATAYPELLITLNELQVFGPPTVKPNLYTSISHTGGTTFSVGQTINYMITTSNLAGNGAAAENQIVTVTDLIPSGLANIVITGNNWQVTNNSTISPTSITAIYTGLYPINAGTTLPPLLVSGTLTSNAIPSFTTQAASTSIDALNNAIDTITVLPMGASTVSDLSLTQTHLGNDPFKVGHKVTSILTVSNALATPSGAHPISVIDALPAGLKDIQIRGIGWIFSINEQKSSPMLITAYYLSSSQLAAHADLPSIIITGTLTDAAIPIFWSTATVNAPNDSNASNNRSVDVIAVEKEQPQNSANELRHDNHQQDTNDSNQPESHRNATSESASPSSANYPGLPLTGGNPSFPIKTTQLRRRKYDHFLTSSIYTHEAHFYLSCNLKRSTSKKPSHQKSISILKY